MPATRRRAPRGVVVALEGPSGVGKSALAERLARASGWRWLREAYDRLSPRPSLGFANPEELLALERRLLREDARRFREARRAAERGARVLADTDFLGPLAYTRGLADAGIETGKTLPTLRALALRASRAGAWGFADLYVYLDAPERTVAQRTVRAESTHPSSWRARHRRVGRRERAFWLRELAELLPGRVIRLDARGSLGRLATRFERRVRPRIRRLRPIPPAGARRVLARFGPRRPDPAERNRYGRAAVDPDGRATRRATIGRKGARVRMRRQTNEKQSRTDGEGRPALRVPSSNSFAPFSRRVA
jgi:thymidylate kinase